jgi:hypothetical protein
MPFNESSLVHPDRPDRSSSGHFASALHPIDAIVNGHKHVIQVTMFQDCPVQIRNHYIDDRLNPHTGKLDLCPLISEASLVFWTFDLRHCGLSLNETLESINALTSVDFDESPF